MTVDTTVGGTFFLVDPHTVVGDPHLEMGGVYSSGGGGSTIEWKLVPAGAAATRTASR